VYIIIIIFVTHATHPQLLHRADIPATPDISRKVDKAWLSKQRPGPSTKTLSLRICKDQSQRQHSAITSVLITK